MNSTFYKKEIASLKLDIKVRTILIGVYAVILLFSILKPGFPMLGSLAVLAVMCITGFAADQDWRVLKLCERHHRWLLLKESTDIKDYGTITVTQKQE